MELSEKYCQECSKTNPKFAVSVLAEGSLAIVGSWIFDWVFHNPYCGLLFRF